MGECGHFFFSKPHIMLCLSDRHFEVLSVLPGVNTAGRANDVPRRREGGRYARFPHSSSPESYDIPVPSALFASLKHRA